MAAKDSTPRIACTLKLRPTCAQQATFRRWLWNLTGVYNWTSRRIETAVGPPSTYYELAAMLIGHSSRIGIPLGVLRGTVLQAHGAWKRHNAGLARRPKLKSRRRPLNSLLFSNGVNRIANGRVHLAGIGAVRFHRQEIPEGPISGARMLKRASGWHLCLTIKAYPKPVIRVASGQVGIDPGFASLVTLSTGEKVEHPHEYANTEIRLAQAKRGRHRKLVSRIYERIAQRRRDRNHKLARRLVAENAFIAFSKDRTSALARTFGKSVHSAAHADLRQHIARKSLTGGARYVEVDSRNSTRTCSACQARTGPTGWRGLSIRLWQCACGAIHDRDVNAARNTLRLGLEQASENGREAVLGIATQHHREVHGHLHAGLKVTA